MENETKQEENKEITFDITKLTADVYNQIATWHNDKYQTDALKGQALKIISHNIVEGILDEFFETVGLNSRMEVSRGDTIIGSEDSKDKTSFLEKNPKDTFSKLFIKKEKQ
jgi:hypothetical protein